MGKKLALAAALVLLIAGVATGAYFVGRDTRMSDKEVALKTSLAVEKTTVEQEAIRRRALGEAHRAEEREARRERRKVRREMKKAAEEQAAQSYASGQSVGFESGHSEGAEEGFEDGLTEGSDDLTCSDDPDVYWLPPCF